MKAIKLSLIFVLFSTIFISCAQSVNYDEVSAVCDERRIYLYGETHGVSIILQKEIELWEEYYNDYGFRYLFMELPYATAQYLNLWMMAEDNELLDLVHRNLEGTKAYTDDNYNFYVEIKKRCPETIFVGTDVCHQHYSTGIQYLKYLEAAGLKDTEEYKIAEENYKQGQEYSRLCELKKKDSAEIYRETCMIMNFKDCFKNLPQDEKIMGIYGSYHTNLKGVRKTKPRIEVMANQLNKYYESKEGIGIYTLSLSNLK